MTHSFPTINAISESLLNPQDRFRTLKRVIPHTDHNGQPHFSLTSEAAGFPVTIGDREYLLRIPLGWDERQRLKAADYAHVTELSCCSHIVLTKYLKDELLIFDRLGAPLRCDIIQELIPEGMKLKYFLKKQCTANNGCSARAVLSGFAEMQRSLSDNDIVHGKLKPDSIIITEDNIPLITGFVHSRERDKANDRTAILSMALLTYITACEYSLFATLWNSRPPADLLKNLKLQAEFDRNEKLSDIIKIAENARNISDTDASSALESLAIMRFTPMPLLIALLNDSEEGPAPNIARDIKTDYLTDDKSLRVNFSECDHVGMLSDTLIRYRKDRMWGYADKHGVRISHKVFQAASDFYEGRAAVCTETGFGLLDRNGKYIMEPLYETLDWYGEFNIATACLDGKWKLYDRTGNAITEFGYDWIGEPSEGTMMVRRGNKFGYIRTDGTTITDIRYNEAFSFHDGKALVSVSGEFYHIDRDGKRA